MNNTGTLINTFTTEDTCTEHGMVTNSTSGVELLDMFFKMGASRMIDERSLETLLKRAMREDALLATKAVFYNRDIRGGQGERRSFRIFYKYLCNNYPLIAKLNIPNVVKYGRADDLLVAFDTPVEGEVLLYISKALLYPDTNEQSALIAKWLPRENKKNGHLARKIYKYMGISARAYRKIIATLSNTVEQRMCKKEWSDIEYNKVPSVAINKYRKAWHRNDGERYKNWVASLVKNDGTAKINASAIFPHTIVSKFLSDDRYMSSTEASMLEAQWNALPNYLSGDGMILPICDVSSSMSGLPMEVCVSLGLYISERNVGPFQNAFITFSSNPRLEYLRDTSLRERVKELARADWGYSTDLEKTFKMLLKKAVQFKVPASEMPRTLLILSDMQFKQASHWGESAIKMIDRMYHDAGYARPNIAFWNLRTSTGVPVKFDTNGTCLISGFSPSILKTILAGASFNPMQILLDTLNDERYSSVVV